MNSASARRSLLMPQNGRPSSPVLASPAYRAAEPRPHRIDEDKIGELQPGLGVVDQTGRRFGYGALVAQLQSSGAERADVQPRRARPRAAVEYERDRPRGDVLAVLAVADVEHESLGPSLLSSRTRSVPAVAV